MGQSRLPRPWVPRSITLLHHLHPSRSNSRYNQRGDDDSCQQHRIEEKGQSHGETSVQGKIPEAAEKRKSCREDEALSIGFDGRYLRADGLPGHGGADNCTELGHAVLTQTAGHECGHAESSREEESGARVVFCAYDGDGEEAETDGDSYNDIADEVDAQHDAREGDQYDEGGGDRISRIP